MALIRFEQSNDIAAIRDLHLLAFPVPGEARLVDALRAAGNLSVSLVAFEDEIVVGLAPIAVLNEHRRRGIG